jgi:hypothetical protein
MPRSAMRPNLGMKVPISGISKTHELSMFPSPTGYPKVNQLETGRLADLRAAKLLVLLNLLGIELGAKFEPR